MAAELSAFDELLQKVRNAQADAREGDVKRLLEAGKKLGRPFPAATAVRPFLRRNLDPSPEVLYLAAENARLVGDFRTAVSRYKTYLAEARPGARSSESAGNLYMVLIDFLKAEDDAYRWMREHGDRFREDRFARKFDGWFLEQAKRRRDHAAYAKRLALVMRDRLPLEQERLYFWEHLDWLMTEISHARNEHHDALPHCKSIIRSMRGSRERQLRYGLYAANLEFSAGRALKDKAQLEADFAVVVGAAKAYFDAFPKADALKSIVH
ncbi:MAG: hypothetical protein ACYSU0_00750, partial [Planctomycetota bacterium]